jgi:MoxR-like ATPase/Mg-chelatase subunit ChlD
MLRALAGHLGGETDRFVDVTGDEQLTAHALVGTFDPPLVLKGGYRPEYFMPGPLARTMLAGGILYVEELNRAPSGALNALMTALSEGYLEVPRFGRIESKNGFTVVGALNPLDDVGTARLSRGLADRFIVLELDYQPLEEEMEIVRRRCGTARLGFHAFAVEVGRESRGHPDLRHGASVRAAIDLVDLLAAYQPDEIDLETLRLLACTAFAGKVRVRPTVNRAACAIVHELIDTVLRRDHGGSFQAFLESAAGVEGERLAEAEGERRGAPGDDPEVALEQGGESASEEERKSDEIPGMARPGGSGDPGESRSVPMVDRDQPSEGGVEPMTAGGAVPTHRRALEEVLGRAREHVLRARDGVAHSSGAHVGNWLRSRQWSPEAGSGLDLEATAEAWVATATNPQSDDIRVLVRERQTRNHVILIDHSGSMAGKKLELGATMAAILAELSAAGRADYGVVAFDQELSEVKALGEEQDVEQVVDRILRLPEGRATDLGKAFGVAVQLSERLPEATDVVLISDCMPTKGERTFKGLAGLVKQVPSLYICFTDERSAAIQLFHGERQMNLYEWWARRWVGEERFREVGEVEEVDRLIDLLSSGGPGGP